jgi:hypothetical protein
MVKNSLVKKNLANVLYPNPRPVSPSSKHIFFKINLNVIYHIQRGFLLLLTGSTALRFTAAGGSFASRRKQILPTMSGAKGNSYLFTYDRGCRKCCPSTHRHSSHQRKFRFTLSSCSAGIFAISLRIFSFSSPVRGLDIGPTSFLALTAHQTPTFTGWSRTS